MGSRVPRGFVAAFVPWPPGDLGALLLEALSRGAEVLVAERGLKPRAD